MSDELKNYLGNINYEIETTDIELEKLDLGLNAKSWKELLGYINALEDYKQRNEKAINILELSGQNKGISTRPETDTIQSVLNILKGDKDE